MVMPATLKQIARETGVSIKTVSRILSGHSDLHRPETRERVLKAAQDLGYLFNSSARALRQGRFGCIALVLSADLVFSMTPTGLVGGILDACAAERLHLTLAQLS